jgi:BarA-like signal transduction histidine kinase
MAVTVEDFKAYVHAETDTSTIPASCLASALSKARTAGIPAFKSNAHYDMFLLALAAMYYDNRGLTFADPSLEAAAQRMTNSFVLELRYATEDQV